MQKCLKVPKGSQWSLTSSLIEVWLQTCVCFKEFLALSGFGKQKYWASQWRWLSIRDNYSSRSTKIRSIRRTIRQLNNYPGLFSAALKPPQQLSRSLLAARLWAFPVERDSLCLLPEKRRAQNQCLCRPTPIHAQWVRITHRASPWSTQRASAVRETPTAVALSAQSQSQLRPGPLWESAQ